MSMCFFNFLHNISVRLGRLYHHLLGRKDTFIVVGTGQGYKTSNRNTVLYSFHTVNNWDTSSDDNSRCRIREVLMQKAMYIFYKPIKVLTLLDTGKIKGYG